MLFSVVILSYNSSRTLDECLRNVVHTLGQFDEPSEVFVVENGSSDSSLGILKEYQKAHPEMVKPIIFNENTGTTFSRNAALKESTGEYVLVLDSDAYMKHDVLSTLKTYLDDNEKVGLVAPKLTYADGRFQLSTDTFPTLARKVKRFLSLDSMQGSVDEDNLIDQKVDYAISACWLIKRSAVDATAGFDEKIFYSPEDVDFCVQIWLAGYEIHYTPGVSIVHDAQELSRGFKLSKFHFSHLGGLFYLFNKYGYFFTLNPLYKKIHMAMHEN